MISLTIVCMCVCGGKNMKLMSTACVRKRERERESMNGNWERMGTHKIKLHHSHVHSLAQGHVALSLCVTTYVRGCMWGAYDEI